MTLKEYIVVNHGDAGVCLWIREQWLTHLADARKTSPGYDPPIITTFNADEQLQEQKGLRWVNVADRWPDGDNKKIYFVKFRFNRKGDWYNGIASFGSYCLLHDGRGSLCRFSDDILWLDEETEPGQPVPAGEWISVESGVLPEKRIRVITWDGFIHSDAYVDFDGKWKWTHPETRGEAWQDAGIITHWHPLPAPPSPKQDNQ